MVAPGGSGYAAGRTMRSIHVFQSGRPLRRATARAAAGILLLAFCGAVLAGETYLRPGRPDGIALLPPPPAAGSAWEKADLNTVREVLKARTPAQEERAFRSASLRFEYFTNAVGPVLDLSRLPRTDALLKAVKKETGEVINIPKDHWERNRPYVLDPELNVGRPERSFSYPSGHSTRGTLYSLVMAELFPEQREAVLEIGRNIGWDRIVIGKHFPTDVFAGRVLGKAIFREFMANPDFQRDLKEAREEIAAARRRAAAQSVTEEAALR